MKYFLNPFEDYSTEIADNFIRSQKPCDSSKVVRCLDYKWEATVKQFQNLSSKSYSVYTGTSGYALLKLLKNPNNNDNLWEVKQLLSLHNLKNQDQTFLCGDAGPLAIGAVASYGLGEEDEVKVLISRLLQVGDDAIDDKSNFANEYLYGRAGYLYALLYVNKYVEPSPIPSAIIRQVIEAILHCGQKGASINKLGAPLMYQWYNTYYMGAAHGVAGIMYLLLQARDYLTKSDLFNLVKPTIDYLAGLRYSNGNYPTCLETVVDKVQWCHGAPGFVFLFSLAYKVFGYPQYLKLALEAGEIVWERGLLRKGYSICHGVSGNAYCFLELYQTTKDEMHLYRAVRFAEWCVDYTSKREEHYPDHPLSLFEGIAGPMYLLLDIQNPIQAKFPGFTL